MRLAMIESNSAAPSPFHNHVFLGEGHEKSERRTWAVIWLCAAMMVLEIVGGWLFGSIALIADGLHMSTHAGALLLAALGYAFARRHAKDPRFTFGTGKFGDLAGFASALILAAIALMIGYEAVNRMFAPVPIRFDEAIPIAALGLAVNLVSAWLLGGGHHHGHGHAPGAAGHYHEESRRIDTPDGAVILQLVEEGGPARFRLRRESGLPLPASAASIETLRPDGSRQVFRFIDRGGLLESADDIPEPHEFAANLSIDGRTKAVEFEEHEHEHAHGRAARDNNLRAAFLHVVGDAAVSLIVIVGLVLARTYRWLWMDPAAGIIGALVIASWALSLIRDTSAILLDMNPDPRMADSMRRAIEGEGDRDADLHLWRLGPGHLGAIVSIVTPSARSEADYRAKLARFPSLSHLTIEVRRGA